VRRALLAVAIGVFAAGCGGESDVAAPPPTTTSAPPPTTTAPETGPPVSLELFFLAPDGKLVATSREVEHTQTPGAATLDELTSAPSGATTQVPGGLKLTIANGAARVTGATLDGAALAQVVYSLSTFPTVRSVNGKTRADVEEFAPPILVEQPAPGEQVTSPIHVTGTANTFEATFNYKLEDAAGKVIAKNFVTASSGSGTRGTFDFSVPYTVDSPQNGLLRVFELSAEDGSVIHERDIPLRLTV
jgi:Immunoglobulin-like domain of bacterial spore germination